MNNILLLASSTRGIARARLCNDRQPVVDQVATDHEVTCLAAGAATQRTLYAGTRNGVLRSDDSGATWRNCGLAGVIVKSLAVSPHDAEVIYAGTKPAAMFVSRDGGRSWRELDAFRRIPNRWWWFSPAEPGDWRAYVMAIAISPANPDVILAGVELGAVVRSDDGGETWSRHRRGALRDCHTLKFHATSGDWVYQAGGGGASLSRNGGVRFYRQNSGLARKYGIVCAADPESPEIWYVCVAPSPFNAFGENPRAHLYRAAGGAGWTPIGWQAHPLPVTPTALTTVPGAPGQLYVGLYNGDVWHTVDHGDSCIQLPVNLGRIRFSLLVVDGAQTEVPARLRRKVDAP